MHFMEFLLKQEQMKTLWILWVLQKYILVEYIFNTSILRRKNLHLNLEHFRCHLKQPFQSCFWVGCDDTKVPKWNSKKGVWAQLWLLCCSWSSTCIVCNQVCMCQSLDYWPQIFRATIHDLCWMSDGNLYSLPYLPENRLWTSVAHRKSNSIWITSVLWMLFRKVNGHAVMLTVSPYVLSVLVNPSVSTKPSFTSV